MTISPVGRISRAVMDGMEGGAGRVASGYFGGLNSRGRRWAMGLALLAAAVAGVAGLTIVGAGDNLDLHREQLRVLQERGIAVDAPVIGLKEYAEGRGAPNFIVVVQLPPGHRIDLDADRLPGPLPDIADTVPVVYDPQDPALTVPEQEVTQQSRVRADRRTLTTAWSTLALTPLPLAIAAVLWRRSRPPAEG